MNRLKINWELMLLIFFQLLLIIGLFLFVKKEYHSDEIWSFGIANGSESGAVFQNAEEEKIHENEWTSAEVFHENLTVQENERFDFHIPYQNAKDDAHPPLSFLIIHLLASFFPDVFSFWFYIPINLLALVLCDVFLYKLLRLFRLPDYASLGIVFWYAFCAGGINTMVYIRMYALVTAFAVMITYFSMKVAMEQKVTSLNALALIMVCFLGSLTEYEFYVYAFILTVAIGGILLFQKCIKTVFQYGFCMASGVILSLLAFPEFFNDIMKNTNGEGLDAYIDYPYGLQLRMVLNLVLRDVLGFAPSVYTPFGDLPVYLGIAVYVLLLALPICFWLRKSSSFYRVKDRIKKIFLPIGHAFVTYRYMIYICLVEGVAMVLLFNKMISVYHMGNSSVRYFFIIYPVLICFFGVFLFCILSGLPKKAGKWIYILIVVFLVLYTQKTGSYSLLGVEQLEGNNIADVRNSNIIVVTKSHGELERIAHIVDSSNYFYSVEYNEFAEYSEEIKDMPCEGEVYVVLSEGALAQNGMSQVFQEEKGQPLNVQDISYEDIVERNKEIFVEEMIQQDFGKSCEYLGKEVMLNSTFVYYKLSEGADES